MAALLGPREGIPQSGHPLDGRSQGQKTKAKRRKLIASTRGNNARHLHSCRLLTAPVFSLCRLRTESHQTPVGIKLAAMLRDRPGGVCHPRETLVPSRVQGLCSQSLWLSPRRYQSLGGSRLGRFSNLHSEGSAKAVSKSVEVVAHQSAFLAHRLWPNRYPKQRLTSKGFCSRSMW